LLAGADTHLEVVGAGGVRGEQGRGRTKKKGSGVLVLRMFPNCRKEVYGWENVEKGG